MSLGDSGFVRCRVFLMRIVAFVAIAAAMWGQSRPPVTSHIVIGAVDGRKETILHSSSELFEAPNWSPDGQYLLLNSRGRLWKLAVNGGEPVEVPTVGVTRANNDHGISPDGKTFVLSAGHIYTVAAEGGEPKQITSQSPSYYHGWSPDGRWLAYCAPRKFGDAQNFDLYRIAVEGGAEQRLTTHAGYDDGPDYSPDGRWIYFNSDRSGSWDIWRIPAEGAGDGDARAERITSDAGEDWFPHLSPDGRWMVYVTFEKGTKGHPPNQQVTIQRREMKTGKTRTIYRLFGGQGTMNVNSWAPDSRRFAFVRYELR